MSKKKTGTSIRDLLQDVVQGNADTRQAASDLGRPNYPPSATPERAFGAPHARRGENPLTSRGFSFLRLFGVMSRKIDEKDAAVEAEVCRALRAGTHNVGWSPSEIGSIVAPLGMDFLPPDVSTPELRSLIQPAVAEGVRGADPGEVAWLRQRLYAPSHRRSQSWLDSTLGGSLVAPPEQGELIELMRNKEALVAAGARIVPLPPQGRIQYPRQTTSSTAYWVGENQTITQSQVKTGMAELQAKKLAVLLQLPNELIRFAGPAAEALLRDDMTKSLALGLDLAGLEGVGSSNSPKGIINYANINTVTASKTGTNGDTFQPQDAYRMIAAIEEVNGEFEGFVMRPSMWNKVIGFRADATSPQDAAGPFVMSILREIGQNFGPQLAGYPVTKSTQVSRTRSKGSASNLSYIAGGMWSDLLIGMWGAIEFLASNVGDTPLSADQTWVRAILHCDTTPRHEANFAVCDKLIYL